MTEELAGILRTWLNNHRILKDHFKVYKKSEWPEPDPTGPYLDWPFEANAVIYMDCSDATTDQTRGYMHVCLSIGVDHVYFSHDYDSSKDLITYKISAASPDFFNQVESDLIENHWTNFRYELCNVEKETTPVRHS